MKSLTILLGVAVSVLSAASLAADEKKYWEQRELSQGEEGAGRQRGYWESREANPLATPAEDPQGTEVIENGTTAEAAGEPAAAQPAQAPQGERGVILPRGPFGRFRAAARNAAEPNLVSRIGISAEAGGGFGGFVDNHASIVTSIQGQWNARMVFGTRKRFAGEAAYIGSAQSLDTLSVSTGAVLTGNGLEGAFRYNFLTGGVQPYASAGLGWMHYEVAKAAVATADLASGDVATFPFSAGVAWRVNRVVLDGRLTFAPSTRSDVVNNAFLSTWGLTGRAGFEF